MKSGGWEFWEEIESKKRNRAGTNEEGSNLERKGRGIHGSWGCHWVIWRGTTLGRKH